MSLTRYWTWDYEIHGLGSWPTRPPYTGHTEPVEIIKAEDVRAVLKVATETITELLAYFEGEHSHDHPTTIEAKAVLIRLQEISHE